MDPSVDTEFYSFPRFVTHIDERCIDALAKYYGSVLPEPATHVQSAKKPRVLDVASSWISHLPEDWGPSNSEVVGIGMNAAELAKNRALARYAVVDLNDDPHALTKRPELCAGQEGTYDAVICSVSIDYLVKPKELLHDLAGLLKKDGTIHLAFSNRCFPTKVVKRWLDITEEQRCDMVADYLHFAGTGAGTPAEDTTSKATITPGHLYGDIEILTVLEKSWSGDPLWVIRAKKR